MNKKEKKRNEKAGILSIIVVVLFSAIALFYFFNYLLKTSTPIDTIPLNTPAPLPEGSKK
jgi:hypothetical protein